MGSSWPRQSKDLIYQYGATMKNTRVVWSIACCFLPLAMHAVAGETTCDAAIQPSKAVEKEGLSVTIAPAKADFAPDEPLCLVVTYRNTSDKPLRLPPGFAACNYWSVSLQEPGVKERLTGKVTLPMGRFRPGQASEAIAPGKSVSVTARLIRFGYTVACVGTAASRVSIARRQTRGELSLHMFPEADSGPKADLWPGKEISTGDTTIEVRAAKGVVIEEGTPPPATPSIAGKISKAKALGLAQPAARKALAELAAGKEIALGVPTMAETPMLGHSPGKRAVPSAGGYVVTIRVDGDGQAQVLQAKLGPDRD